VCAVFCFHKYGNCKCDIWSTVTCLFLSLRTRAVIPFMQNVNRNFWHVVYVYVSTLVNNDVKSIDLISNLKLNGLFLF